MIDSQTASRKRRSDRWLGTGLGASLVLGCLTLASVSCATKTATFHRAPFFNPTPTRQAINAVDAGDGDLEIAGLRKVVMARPEDVDARLRLASAYAARGFADVAVEHYRIVCERFPDSLKAALRLARALRQGGEKEEALAGFKAFIHNHPQRTSEPYEWLGILNDDLQDWKASQLAYETALLYSPNSAELHNNLGYALLMQYLNQSAATEFRAALRIKKDLVIARNNLGIALAENPKEAMLHWQAVSGPAAAHNNMAALFIERGNYPEARNELAAALSYDQQNAQAIYNLALVSERDGKPAVLPQPKPQVASAAKQPGTLSKFFHPGRHTGKQADTQTLAAEQTSEHPVPLTGSGSGN